MLKYIRMPFAGMWGYEFQIFWLVFILAYPCTKADINGVRKQGWRLYIFLDRYWTKW